MMWWFYEWFIFHQRAWKGAVRAEKERTQTRDISPEGSWISHYTGFLFIFLCFRNVNHWMISIALIILKALAPLWVQFRLKKPEESKAKRNSLLYSKIFMRWTWVSLLDVVNIRNTLYKLFCILFFFAFHDLASLKNKAAGRGLEHSV